MNPRITFRRVNWKWSLPGLILVALFAVFFNPPDSGVTSGEFEFGMATQNEGGSVSLEELLVSSLAQTDALARLLIEKVSSTSMSFCKR
jgi:hypothetical protein